ncbi:hypothetical protein GOA97_01795 [Sinorhizobium meliloti]|nr:hypothetical protein [Sinorhizobium meliloti]MDW9940043.1 hypothetical protein [Sinorhizobium meliloti]MDW9944307.1 hypothetical protein [Sinorhizobium meliloti]MDX0105554.1 hypothetical protein [Sinorhizobium meliloti]MQW53284.1 hypothetical protein [Sinorhizobium meliloti]
MRQVRRQFTKNQTSAGRIGPYPLPTKGEKMPDLPVSFAEGGASDR